MKPRACNIFCDASIDNTKHIACAGALFVSDDCTKILSEYRVRQNSATNNSAEILAILTGLRAALSMREMYGYKLFNLFSDSKISIYGLREWMYGWVKRQQRSSGYLIGSSGKPVKNQDYFKECVRLIVDNNLEVNLFHQNGHIPDADEAKMQEAYATFITSNGIPPEKTGVNIAYASYYNNIVDTRTREVLTTGNESVPFEYKAPIMYCISEQDMIKYSKLIKMRYS